MQNDPGKDTVYLVYFPEASNPVAELLVAGYQKFMENDFWGLSSATTQIKDYAQQYGTEALTLDGHSRGAMTIGNALESLLRSGQTGSLTGTNINLFGPAYNAQDMANMLSELSDKKQTSVNVQNHADDFVGRFIGGNDATYGSTPTGSSLLAEWWNMLGGETTVHNCYGAGPSACGERYGTPVTIPVNAK